MTADRGEWSVSHISWSTAKEREPRIHQTGSRKGVVVKITMTYIYKGRVPKVVKHVDSIHCQMKSRKKRRTFSGQPTSIPENTLFTTCAK
jgi:hypothetical protein